MRASAPGGAIEGLKVVIQTLPTIGKLTSMTGPDALSLPIPAAGVAEVFLAGEIDFLGHCRPTLCFDPSDKMGAEPQAQ